MFANLQKRQKKGHSLCLGYCLAGEQLPALKFKKCFVLCSSHAGQVSVKAVLFPLHVLNGIKGGRETAVKHLHGGHIM